MYLISQIRLLKTFLRALILIIHVPFNLLSLLELI